MASTMTTRIAEVTKEVWPTVQAAMDQITRAHEEMHDPDAVGGLFMDLPHTHEGA